MAAHSHRFLLPAIFILAAQMLPAQSRISWLEGQVSVSRDGRETAAAIDDDVFEGDRITTGADSLVIIELREEGESRGTLKLRADTSLVLDSTDGETSVELLRGGLFSRIRRLTAGQNRNYRVRTPNAVAAVRGTEFFVAFGRQIESEPDVWLCVNEGAVEVALTDSGKSVLVNEGEGINILAGNRITDPKFYSWTRDLNWNTDPDSGEVADATDLDGAYADLRDFDYD